MEGATGPSVTIQARRQLLNFTQCNRVILALGPRDLAGGRDTSPSLQRSREEERWAEAAQEARRRAEDQARLPV